MIVIGFTVLKPAKEIEHHFIECKDTNMGIQPTAGQLAEYADTGHHPVVEHLECVCVCMCVHVRTVCACVCTVCMCVHCACT